MWYDQLLLDIRAGFGVVADDMKALWPRLLPTGGSAGQVATRTASGGVEWQTPTSSGGGRYYAQNTAAFGNVAWNWQADSNDLDLRLTGNATLSIPSNLSRGKVATLRVSGNYTLNFASGFKNNSLGELAYTPNRTRVYVFRAVDTATIELVSARTVMSDFLLNNLDVQPFLAASAARSLLEGYTGNLINVYKGAGGNQAIGITPGGSLNTTALSSFVGSDSAYVGDLYLQVGGGSFTQADAAKRPRIVNAGAIDGLNGKPGLRALGGQILDKAVSATGNQLTVCLVGSMDSSTAAYGRLASLGVAGSFDYNNVAYAALLNRDNQTANVRSERAGALGSVNVGFNTLFSYIVRFDGANVTIFLNGNQVYSGVFAGNFNANLLRLFAQTDGATFWNGHFFEVEAFYSSLAATDIATIVGNQRAFYSF